MPIRFTARTRLLFIGDSITDAGRLSDPDQIGSGYVRIVRDHLRAKEPLTAPEVINMGVGGNNVMDLSARWRRDVIDQRPDIVSVMVGVNDVWHRLAGWGLGVPLEQFERTYRDLLAHTRAMLPACQLILCEPTIIVKPAPENGNAALQPYIKAIHRVAEEAGITHVVPAHGALLEARHDRPDIDWTPDGVHPSSSGHMVIARAWLGQAGAL